MSWVSNACIYGSVSKRRRELIGKSTEPSFQFAKRVMELHLSSPVSPLARLSEHLDQVTRSSPPEMDPNKEHFVEQTYSHITTLLQESRRVANYVRYRIGTLLNKIASRHQLGIVDLELSLCNFAGISKSAYYRRIRDECSHHGCSECSAAKDSDGGPENQRRPPCDLTQSSCGLKEVDFQNFTQTFLDQCREVAMLPEWSPLVWSSDPQGQARDLVEKARNISATIGLPSIATGITKAPVFSLKKGESPVEAIQYIDGDGGYLVCELFPGLNEYLEKSCTTLPECLNLQQTHGYYLMPFREQYHDAIELSHVYKIIQDTFLSDTEVTSDSHIMEWGYDALVASRGNLARAEWIFIIPDTDTTYTSTSRLFVEIFSLEAGERLPKATGVRLIERGLSYPTSNAPPAYQTAWAVSVDGIHRFRGLSDIPSLCPWELKSAFGASTQSVDVNWDQGDQAFTCHVTMSTEHLNEANVLVLKSTLDGAGLGLFLTPTPPHRTTRRIQKGKTICLYSNKPTLANVNTMESTDYLMEVFTHGRMVRFNPDVFTGSEMGRFINQGGLLEGVKKLCIECDRGRGSTGFSAAPVNEEIRRHCNITYKPVRLSVLNVVADETLLTSSEPQELLGNYTISYWLRFVVQNLPDIGNETEYETGILWTLLSQNSSYDGHDVDLETLERIPPEYHQKYRNMVCPFPFQSRTRARIT